MARVLCVVAVLSLTALSVLSATKWDREAAEAALTEARLLREEIRTSPSPVIGQYLRCIATYRQVYYKDPHYGGCDNALFEAAELYSKMGEKFGKPLYFKDAVRLIQFMLKDYPLSRLAPDALLLMGDLLSSHLEDLKGAEESYSELKTRYRSSKAAAVLKSRVPLVSPVPKVHPTSKEAVGSTSVPIPLQRVPTQGAVQQAAGTGTRVSDSPGQGYASVLSIRHWSTSDYTRVIIDLDNQTRYTRTRLSNPDRIYFDISDAKLNRDLLNKTFVVGDALLKQIRAGQNRADLVRVVLDFGAISDYSVFELYDPYRIVVDIHGARKQLGSRIDQVAESKASDKAAKVAAARDVSPLADEHKKTEATATLLEKETTRPPSDPVSDKGGAAKPSSERPVPTPKENSLPSETALASNAQPSPPARADAGGPSKSGRSNPAVSESPPLPKTAQPNSRGNRTLTRMLGLKIGRIVLDPGHGGHDTGTIGRGGMMEKDLVLKVAADLKGLLEERLGAEVVLTRDADKFISLEERTAIANQHSADLFLSIHANSSNNRTTSGVETYYLNFAKSDADREVAARENATTVRNISDLQDLVRKIAQAEKSSESREFASIVQKKLYGGARQLFPSARNRGVRTAPFVVLIGANMPSVLAEVAFISNPRDEKVLKQDDNRQRIVQALFAGIEGYMKTLGSEVAQSHAGSN